MIGDLRVALTFLTRLPLGAQLDLSPGALSRAAVWFPVVGVLVGAVMGGVHALAGLAVGPAAATVVALVAAILMTGGFHEDGLADCADAAGAHVGLERRHEILHDPRVGTYGALALVIAVVLPVTLLTGLDDGEFLAAAVCGHALGRWSGLPLSWRVRPARPSGKGTLLAVGPGTTAAGTVLAAVACLAVAGPAVGAVAAGVAVLVTLLGAVWALRIFGGVSGDVFGAVNKVVEIAVYAVAACVWT